MNTFKNSVNEVPPLISIIIVNYKSKDFSIRCLNSVLKTDYPNFEVIFCDNASGDGSVELVKEELDSDSRLKIVINRKNYGAAEGNNIGASYANFTAKYLVFLNNDTEVDTLWLKSLVNVMEKNEDVAAAGCKQLLMANHQVIDIVGANIDRFGFLYPRGRLEKDRGQFESIEEVFTYGSTALMVRRNVF